MNGDNATTAQTESRRAGNAGPVGFFTQDAWAVSTPTGRFLGCRHCPGPSLLISELAEPAIELPVVQAVHVAIPVEVEVPQVTGLTGLRVECGPEPIAVQPVQITVPVRVTEQSRDDVQPVTPRRAVPVAVQVPSPAVVDEIRPD